MGGKDEGNRIVASAFQRALSATDGGAPVLAQFFGPAVNVYNYATTRGESQGGSVLGDLGRLLVPRDQVPG